MRKNLVKKLHYKTKMNMTTTKAKTTTRTTKETPTKTTPTQEPKPAEKDTELQKEEETQVEFGLKQRFEALVKKRQDEILKIKQEIQDLRKMQRDHELELKEASKKSKKKRNPDLPPRKPSGFASPVLVSDDLYKFLEKYGVTKGNPVARTEVTKHITSYIKEHDLQNPTNRREIEVDSVLKKLFGEPKEHRVANDETSPKVYTYLKLQTYLSQHFQKKTATLTSSSTPK